MSANESVSHDPVRAQRERRILVLDERAARGVEEFGLGIREHRLRGLAVAFDVRGAIPFKKRYRGPGIGLELSRQLSPPRLDVIELEGAFLGDEILAHEVQRAQRDVDEV